MLMHLLILVIVACFAIWIVRAFIVPAIPAPYAYAGNIITAIVGLIFLLWLLDIAGLTHIGFYDRSPTHVHRR